VNTYRISLRETDYGYCTIEAASAEEALRKHHNGDYHFHFDYVDDQEIIGLDQVDECGKIVREYSREEIDQFEENEE
jgi:hypothetical protein